MSTDLENADDAAVVELGPPPTIAVMAHCATTALLFLKSKKFTKSSYGLELSWSNLRSLPGKKQEEQRRFFH